MLKTSCISGVFRIFIKGLLKKAVSERNEVESTFGTGKRIYIANNIRAKLPETAACWTGMCYFVKNVMKFLRELLRTLILMVYGMRNPMHSGELQENRTGIPNYRIAGTYLFSRPYLIIYVSYHNANSFAKIIGNTISSITNYFIAIFLIIRGIYLFLFHDN